MNLWMLFTKYNTKSSTLFKGSPVKCWTMTAKLCCPQTRSCRHRQSLFVWFPDQVLSSIFLSGSVKTVEDQMSVFVSCSKIRCVLVLLSSWRSGSQHTLLFPLLLFRKKISARTKTSAVTLKVNCRSRIWFVCVYIKKLKNSGFLPATCCDTDLWVCVCTNKLLI